jgi:hypothetical protein
MKFNLDQWEYLFTHDLDVYGYGILRVGIDRETGKKIISYIA